MGIIKKGTWVEIERVLLKPEERAPQVPEDTRRVPYVMRVSGFLENDADIGEEVRIKTLSGRIVEGSLSMVRPHYDHSFGDTVEELLTIGIGGEV